MQAIRKRTPRTEIPQAPFEATAKAPLQQPRLIEALNRHIEGQFKRADRTPRHDADSSLPNMKQVSAECLPFAQYRQFSPPDRTCDVAEPELLQYQPVVSYEGTVIELTKEGFFGQLRRVDNNDGSREQSEFTLNEVSDEDRALLAPGAVFYWTVGYQTTQSGQRKIESEVRFRRLPAWSNSDFDELDRRASALDAFFSE